MWITPKTNWHSSDAFYLNPDYARIKGNLLHLHAMADLLYLPFSLTPMAQYKITDVPCATFFDAVDDNTDRLMDKTFRPATAGHARRYTADTPVWSASDLNRIESSALALYRALESQAQLRPKLAFGLQKGMF